MSRAVVYASQMESALDRILPPYLAKKGREIENVAKRLAPKGKTGRLSRNIHARGYSNRDIRVQCTVDYAAAVHEGSRPHPIPHEAGPLAFYWEREARWFRGNDAWVFHPGQRAQPFLREALEIVMGGR